MKKIILFLAVVSCISKLYAQGTWINHAISPSTDYARVTFTIGTSGYMYTGTPVNNFYEYNSISDTWTQLADLPGPQRTGASGFAIGNYGYIGSGSNNDTPLTDFYQYDVVNNSWTAKSNCPDSARYRQSFSIGGKGYMTGGQTYYGSIRQNICYDPVTDQWTSIAHQPIHLVGGFANVVNGKAYCSKANGMIHFFEYDPIADSWASKSPLNWYISPAPYYKVHSFVINSKIYVPDKNVFNTQKAGLHIYDPTLDSWSVEYTFPTPNGNPCDVTKPLGAFTIANKGYLLAKDSCNSENFWEYDPAHDFKITAIAEDTTCEFDKVDVTFTSNISFNSGNNFKLRLNSTTIQTNAGFSDPVPGTTAGTYSFRIPKVCNSGDNALTQVTVFSTSPESNSYYADSLLFVKRGPYEARFDAQYYACSGSSVLLYRTNTAIVGQTYDWTSNPWGVLGSTNYISNTFTQNTELYAHETYTATGCSLYDTTQMIYTPRPSLVMADSFFSVCSGTTVTLGGIPNPGYVYEWTGSGLNSTIANPAVAPAATTVYTLKLKDTLTACLDTLDFNVQVFSPPLQTLCYVTVDSFSSHNVITWDKLDQPATDSFYLYREVTTNNYSQIAAIHRDSLSEYHDFAANPNVTAYRYKISVKDSCGNYSSNLSPYHNSIHLQYLGSGNLIWNVYLIENDTNPVLSFDVFRDSLANGNWDLMVNVPGSQYTATDINFNQHPNALYRIVANWGHSCTPSRSNDFVLSNIIQLIPNAIGAAVESATIKIYPNPAKDVLVIDAAGAAIESVSVYSTEGRLVKQVILSPNTLQLHELLSGIYFVEVKTDKGVSRLRLAKE